MAGEEVEDDEVVVVVEVWMVVVGAGQFSYQ